MLRHLLLFALFDLSGTNRVVALPHFLKENLRGSGETEEDR